MVKPKPGDKIEPNGVKVWQILDDEQVIGQDGKKYILTRYLGYTADKYKKKWNYFEGTAKIEEDTNYEGIYL